MARALLSVPLTPWLQDAARCLATPPLRLHLPSGICKFGSTRRRSSREISSIVCAARVTGRRRGIKLGARANEAPAGDLVTEGSAIAEEDAETCEIVQGSYVILGEGEDTFQGYLIQAIKNNNGVAVLFLTDVYGFENGDSRDFAYRLACFGYNVLVPDLFRGRPWSKESPKSAYEEWQELHSPDRVARDIDVAARYLIEQIDAAGKLGVVGFSFGGGRLIETLARDPDNLFATGAFVYGTGFESSLASKIKVPLLLIASDSDDQCSPGLVRQIEQQVPGSKAKIYGGFNHDFVDHPRSFEEDEAAEDAFTQIRRWLHDHLLPDSEFDSAD